MTDPRNLIPTADAAKLLDVSTGTIRNWIKAGHITGYTFPGGTIRVDKTELLAAIRPIARPGK